MRSSASGGESSSRESESESDQEEEVTEGKARRQVKVYYYKRMRGEWNPRRHEGVLRMSGIRGRRVEVCNSSGVIVEMKVLTEMGWIGMTYMETGDELEVKV